MSISFDKYSVTQYSVSSLLGFIEAGAIAVPEIQRPFVWRATQVRDLIDSLFNGYPTGYLIIWQNPDVKLKDGGSAVGKKVLIDGQQRVTAMMTAIAGQKMIRCCQLFFFNIFKAPERGLFVVSAEVPRQQHDRRVHSKYVEIPVDLQWKIVRQGRCHTAFVQV